MILTNSTEFVGAANLTWQQHMKLAIRTADELALKLDLPVDAVCPDQSKGAFPLFVPLPYLSRIKVGEIDDPLLKQVLPSADENLADNGSRDPVAESEYSVTSGLLKKYQGRALVVVNGVCAIHCRYCFRRHFPYEQMALGKERWSAALDAIAADPSINEVILSGGDPLTVVDDLLSALIHDIESIDHVLRLRIHTRLPIVIPQRVTERLISTLQRTRMDVVIVVHCNHANEVDASVGIAMSKLKAASSVLLNQSVLLRGVNDNLESLSNLSVRLIESGVLPYYLHQLDPVQGAMHFEVSQEEGIELIQAMKMRLPGYLVPKYVREIPGMPAKTLLA